MRSRGGDAVRSRGGDAVWSRGGEAVWSRGGDTVRSGGSDAVWLGRSHAVWSGGSDAERSEDDDVRRGESDVPKSPEVSLVVVVNVWVEVGVTADNACSRHWGQVVVSPVRTLQTHHKEMDNVPTKNRSSTSQTHPGFSKPI